MARFKKNVVIGGFNGHELEGLVRSLREQAEEDGTVHEFKAVLHMVLTDLILRHPNSPPIQELCEAAR